MNHRIDEPDGWQGLPDDALAWLVIEVIWAWADFYGAYEPFRDQLAALTPGQRGVYCPTWLDREVKNGGFLQFLENPTGMLGPEAVAGFERIGMPASAEAVKAAFVWWGMVPYPREADEREDRLPDDEPAEDVQGPLDDAYYRSTYDSDGETGILQAKQADYIRADLGSWIVGRGSWIVCRGSWFVCRGPWIVGRRPCAVGLHGSLNIGHWQLLPAHSLIPDSRTARDSRRRRRVFTKHRFVNSLPGDVVCAGPGRRANELCFRDAERARAHSPVHSR